MIKEIDPKEPIQFAWNAFVDAMGEQRWGATDAFKWAWEEARKQREWVWLTDKEVDECLQGLPTQTIDVYARRIETKIKEKNNG